MPAQAVISPPDSGQNSSDDEDTKAQRGRELENLAELQAAIRIIEQRRAASPTRMADEITKANQALTLVMPSQVLDKPTVEEIERAAVQTIRKIVHTRSNTDSSIFDLRSKNDNSTTGSDEETLTDDEEGLSMSGRKPPMLRKKSGELVRPALRPSSARRRPSSMPGTPTFSKAVHFDSHLEHVRHFLQVDRPLAVSAGSSPVEVYDSDSEFPFSPEEEESRGPSFEWEIVTSNFPSLTTERLAQPIRLERIFLSADNKTLVGTVAVANLAFNKWVVARFTLDYWKTTSEVVAEFNNDVRQPKHSDGCDRFNFNIKIADQANLEAKTMFFCVKYSVNGQEYWDNNNSTNFQVDFRKKAKPQHGKKGAQGNANKPVHHSLPRSNKIPPRNKSTPPLAYDDFTDGFDSKYAFDQFTKPVNDFLGESTGGRLKGVKSAVVLSSDSFTRRAPKPSGQAFGNRYDFGASLSAAINAANSTLGDKSGIVMKPRKSTQKQMVPDAAQTDSPVSMTSSQSLQVPGKTSQAVAHSASGSDSPRPAGSEKPVLASQSYNELLDKYCFFGSVKSSPQLKDGTLRPGQFDGANDEGYILGSSDSSASNSPVMNEKKASPPRSPNNAQVSRSVSPAPMTGFAMGTSPMYLQHMHASVYPFHDAHTPTAIRG